MTTIEAPRGVRFTEEELATLASLSGGDPTLFLGTSLDEVQDESLAEGMRSLLARRMLKMGDDEGVLVRTALAAFTKTIFEPEALLGFTMMVAGEISFGCLLSSGEAVFGVAAPGPGVLEFFEIDQRNALRQFLDRSLDGGTGAPAFFDIQITSRVGDAKRYSWGSDVGGNLLQIHPDSTFEPQSEEEVRTSVGAIVGALWEGTGEAV